MLIILVAGYPGRLSMSNDVFFQNSENMQVLKALQDKIKYFLDAGSGSDRDRKFYSFIYVTLFYMVSRPEAFDEYCAYNIQSRGSRFIMTVRVFDFADAAAAELILESCYRFLVEYNIVCENEIPDDLHEVFVNFDVRELGLSPNTLIAIKYANFRMVVGVAKHYLHHPQLVSVRELPALLDKAQAEKKSYEDGYASRKEEVENLRLALDSYRDDFNFVGLRQGFGELKKSKLKEKRNTVALLSLLVIVMIIPFGVKFYYFFNPSVTIKFDAEFYIALAGFELLLMYFFRIVFLGFKSVQAQLLQIDLRMTLCQFIQSYATYAKEIKQEDAELLSRFEQVVFSSIVNSDDAIPSTFDGVDQLAKLVASVRKS